MRLQKVLAEAGVASRRECEQMIEAGRVEVNGVVRNELPVFVDPRKDRITVDGRWIEKPKGSSGGKHAERIYVMLNKPDNTLCTTRDEQPLAEGGRKTVVDLVKHHTGARLFPIGRMDYHATGLVLLTNDGLLGERLTHAKYGIGKVYRVVVGGTVSPEQIEILKRRIGKRDAVGVEGEPTGGVVITNAPDMNTRGAPVENTTLEITLREGRTDPIDEVIMQTGLRIKRIGRVGIGPLRMTGVKIGEWRNLTKDEVRTLLEATGLLEPEKPKTRGRHSNKREEGWDRGGQGDDAEAAS